MREPNNIQDEIEAVYREMAADTERESEALEWAEAMISDVMDESLELISSEIDGRELL